MTRRRLRLVHLAAIAIVVVIAWTTSRGSADIQEQRNRLPPPATSCADPVEGVWMSHSFYPNNGQWYIFTLTVRRTASGANTLTGDIHSEFWDGPATNPNPIPCTSGGYHQRVFMEARGTIDGQVIRFGGTSWRQEANLCGWGVGGYNLDQFSGTIDPTILEFQSVNNDGGLAVNEPTVFRRIRCVDPQQPPRPVVRPPPFQPPGTAHGCGC